MGATAAGVGGFVVTMKAGHTLGLVTPVAAQPAAQAFRVNLGFVSRDHRHRRRGQRRPDR
jgi:hypothetical protein